MKNKMRILIDLSMTVLLPLLMAYSLIGETFHELCGTILFVLFITHHILNRKWYGSIFKGKYTARRVFQTVLNFLVLIVMILQPLSGILMSKHLFPFLPSLPISAQARRIHMMLAYWGYVLLCVHAGTHLTVPFRKLVQKDRKASVVLRVILWVVSIYGCAAFIRRGFPRYMSGRTAFAFFDYGEPIVLFLLDHLAVMVLFMMTGYLLVSGLRRTGAERKAGKE